jgi:hypothetical protein
MIRSTSINAKIILSFVLCFMAIGDVRADTDYMCLKACIAGSLSSNYGCLQGCTYPPQAILEKVPLITGQTVIQQPPPSTLDAVLKLSEMQSTPRQFTAPQPVSPNLIMLKPPTSITATAGIPPLKKAKALGSNTPPGPFLDYLCTRQCAQAGWQLSFCRIQCSN